jgi:hypothetical protein
MRTKQPARKATQQQEPGTATPQAAADAATASHPRSSAVASSSTTRVNHPAWDYISHPRSAPKPVDVHRGVIKLRRYLRDFVARYPGFKEAWWRLSPAER